MSLIAVESQTYIFCAACNKPLDTKREHVEINTTKWGIIRLHPKCWKENTSDST